MAFLARSLKKKSIEWTIIEPNPAPVEGVEATFIKGFLMIILVLMERLIP